MSDTDSLLPCPFCGNKFTETSYDRGITYNCTTCKYHRSFEGIVQYNISPVQIQHRDQEGNMIPFTDDKYPEYYHQFAHEIAIAEMNKRWVPIEKQRSDKIKRLYERLHL
jgi:hypothetical protein